jgi:hypothetical protein
MNWRNEQGFLLVSLLLILALLAVTIFTLNFYANTQVGMTVLHRAAVQTDFDQQAVLQESLWQTFANPCYRTGLSGEDVVFNGSIYTRKILNSTQWGYFDALTLTIMAKGGTTSLKRSYQYWSAGITGQVQPQPGTSPTLAMQERICLDGAGNLYIADVNNNRIVKRDPAGVMTLVAGNGTAGFSGDSGLAITAMLKNPSGVGVDPGGNIYIADTRNHRIRRVDIAGIITTVAGTGVGGQSGDGGPAVSATINTPKSIFFHNASNSYYIADSKNCAIRRVDSAGIITTVAGNGVKGYTGDYGAAVAAQLDNPYGVHVRPDGTILICDTMNHVIRQVNTAGIITTVAGSSWGVAGYFGEWWPAISPTVGPDFILSDAKNSSIRRISLKIIPEL